MSLDSGIGDCLHSRTDLCEEVNEEIYIDLSTEEILIDLCNDNDGDVEDSKLELTAKRKLNDTCSK